MRSIQTPIFALSQASLDQALRVTGQIVQNRSQRRNPAQQNFRRKITAGQHRVRQRRIRNRNPFPPRQNKSRHINKAGGRRFSANED